MSADLVNSTRFKQDKKREGYSDIVQPWFEPISQFFRDFERIFSSEWEIYRRLKHTTGPSPILWKVLGDEVIYFKELTNSRQAVACIQIWRQVVHEYRVELKKLSPPLDLKSAAWIAGFPFNNAEIAFLPNVEEVFRSLSAQDPAYANLYLLNEHYSQGSTRKNVILDFVGPHIDTGFRLSSLATPRKLILSVDLALMIAHHTQWWHQEASLEHYPKIEFRYDEKEPIKGILEDEEGYPVFWLDASPDFATADDVELLHVDTDGVTDFCGRFLKERPFPSMPYIDQSHCPEEEDEGFFKAIPNDHREKIVQIQNYWIKETEKHALESKSFSDELAPKESADANVKELATRVTKQKPSTTSSKPRAKSHIKRRVRNRKSGAPRKMS